MGADRGAGALHVPRGKLGPGCRGAAPGLTRTEVEKAVSALLSPRVIEQEIARIREKESNPYSAGTKTNLFTLVIIRQEGAIPPGEPDPAEIALQYMLGKRPARIITIVRVSTPTTDCRVSGRCFPDKRNRGVCFEEVFIECGDDGVGMDPGTWGPLLIRDLPVFAWVPDGLATNGGSWEAALLKAHGLIDKLLVDSARPPSGHGLAALRAVRELRERTAGAFLLSDFSWRRSRVLREQTARAFDPPSMRPLLSSVKNVRLYGGSEFEASLFFLWLRVRLGKEIQVEHAAAGALAEGFRVTFTFTGAPDLDIGCTKGGCLSRGAEKGAYRFPTDGEILLEEVDTLSRDPVFIEVLAHAGRPDA